MLLFNILFFVAYYRKRLWRQGHLPIIKSYLSNELSSFDLLDAKLNHIIILSIFSAQRC